MSATKKSAIFLVLITVSILFGFISAVPANALGVSDLENNSEILPYELSTVEDLLDLSLLVALGEDLTDKYFVLKNDISLVSSGFSPIGDNINQFRGQFDGKGYSITLGLSRDGAYTALFGHIGAVGTVKNLTVKGSVVGGNYSASVAGMNKGVVENCINLATVSARESATSIVGGIAGENTGIIRNCINYGTVKGNRTTGGIVGKNTGDGTSQKGLFSVINLGAVSYLLSTDNNDVIGGLCGENAGVLQNGYNFASISGTSRTGSVVGYLTRDPATASRYCYNITDKSTRGVVGTGTVATPSTFGARSLYQFLSNSNIIFDDNTLVTLPFEEAYGFTHVPLSLKDNTAAKNVLRISLFSQGTGESGHPFVVATLEQWNLFSVNSTLYSYSEKFVSLDRNLVLGNISPLFGGDKEFLGTFDGGGHTVTAAITAPAYAALFEKVGTAGVVKNLVLDGSVATSGQYAGGFFGVLKGSGESLTNHAAITASSHAGGIAAWIEGGTLENVLNQGAVSVGAYGGGIAAYAKNTLLLGQIENRATITCSSTNNPSVFGGIFGCAEFSLPGTLSRLLNAGTIEAQRASRTGGLIGSTLNVTVSESANLGAVKGNSSVGGLVGYMDGGHIKNSLAVSVITAGSYAGGLVGAFTTAASSIENSYFSGKIVAATGIAVDTSTFRILATGQFSQNNAYYNSDLASNVSGYGTACNTVQLTDIAPTGGGVHVLDDAARDKSSVWYLPALAESVGYFPMLSSLSLTAGQEASFVVSYFAGGTGQKTSPYLIGTAQQFYQFHYLYNNYPDYNRLNYALNADISLARTLTPLGTNLHTFLGSFNGKGFSISGLTVVTTEDYSGLFAVIGTSGVVEELYLESGSVTGKSYVGGIAGNNLGTIRTSYNKCSVLSTENNASRIGGIAGSSTGIITLSGNLGSVTGANVYVGGIVGHAVSGSISYVFNSGYIKGGGNVGGIIGMNEASLFGAINSGTVHTTADSYSGGLIGYNYGDLSDSYSTGSFTVAHSNGKAGGIIGYHTGSTVEKSYYNSDLAGSVTTPYYIQTGPVVGLSMTTAEFLDSSFLSYFTEGTFVFSFTPTQDSNFAACLSGIAALGGRMTATVMEALKLRLFGWNDASPAEWGSLENPYLISTAQQLVYLSELSMFYNYTGYCFKLTTDIDMDDLNTYNAVSDKWVEYYFTPIGKYVSSTGSNRMFNGTFSGGGFTISNLRIDYYDNYVGLFAYTGSAFRLSDLYLDETCTISSDKGYVGSFVGYNQGNLNRVVSRAELSGSGNIGGLIGFTTSGVSVTNSLFDGTLPTGVSNVYGILSHPASSVTVNTKNTWYVYTYQVSAENPQGYIKADAEPYLHNGYGSVFFVDKNGTVTVGYNFTAEDAQFISFTLYPNDQFKGFVKDNGDNDISPASDAGYVFYPMNNASVIAGNNVKFYARFTKYVEFRLVNDNDINYLPTYQSGGKYGQGYYYSGQTVNLYVLTLENYILKILNEYKVGGFSLKNSGSEILMQFAMPHTAFAGTIYYVPLQLEYAGNHISIALTEIQNNPNYNGVDRNVQINFEAGSEGLFSGLTPQYYYGINQTSVNAPNERGTYTVRVRMFTSDTEYAGLYTGVATTTFTIQPARLNVIADTGNPDLYWIELAKKIYDGETVLRDVVITYITGVVPIDNTAERIQVICDIIWNSPNAGTGIQVTFGNFRIIGTKRSNYEFATTPNLIFTGIGEIVRKEVTITILEEDLSWEFSDSRPNVKTPIISGAAGEFSWDYYFQKLTSSLAIDTAWDALPSAEKTWSVGIYRLLINVAADPNHNIGFPTVGGSTMDYIVEIRPKIVDEILFDGYRNLNYTSNDLSGGIFATYETVRALDRAILTFYQIVDGAEVLQTSVINAGDYIVYASIAETNYALNRTFSMLFTVGKAAYNVPLTFSTGSTAVTFGTDISLSVSGQSDGLLRVSVQHGGRGEVALEERMDGYYLIPLAYGTVTVAVEEYNATNYFDRRSAYITFTINPATIYVGIANPLGRAKTYFYYGEKIELDFVYSLDIEQNDIISVQSVSGFLAPSYFFDEEEFSVRTAAYPVNIFGGDSDGYLFAPSNKLSFSIAPRPITITVTNNETRNTKVYGDKDGEIYYTVVDDLTGLESTTLPDGRTLTLSGGLARTAGESVAYYLITQGTLTNAKNPNYEISYDIAGTFTVTKRPLQLYIPQITKHYLEKDPVLYAELSEGYSFVGKDNLASITLNLSREPGETVGQYDIIVNSYLGGNNYQIEGIINQEKFVIKKGTPITTASLNEVLRYGSTLSSVSMVGNATYLGQVVQGTFMWSKPSETANEVGLRSFTAIFFPFDDNLEYITFTVQTEVQKRLLTVLFEGSLDYVYSGRTQGNIEVKLENMLESNPQPFHIELSGTPIDVGLYTMTVTVDSPHYAISGVNSVAFHINPKPVSVSFADASIFEGDKFVPQIDYQGFVTGETSAVLTKAATVKDVPLTSGIYFISAQGAEAKNYTFSYLESTLTVCKKQIGAEGVTISGKINPELTLSVYYLSNNSDDYTQIKKLMDERLGVKLFKPSAYTLNEYVQITLEKAKAMYAARIFGAAADSGSEQYTYTVSLSTLAGDAKVYLRNSDGTMTELKEYSWNPDDKTITFTAGNIKGLAVYGKKSIPDLLLGYVPIAVAVVVLLGVMLGTIAAMRAVRKKEKKRRSYLK